MLLLTCNPELMLTGFQTNNLAQVLSQILRETSRAVRNLGNYMYSTQQFKHERNSLQPGN